MVVFFASTRASAQAGTTGSIEGAVTDQSGAAKSDTTITVTGSRIARPHSATADGTGVFSFTELPPGKYTISVEAANGYKRFELRNVSVRAGKVTKVAISLKKAT
jgi:hypothetical protein